MKGSFPLDTIRLSNRLLAVASFVEKNSVVADVGSDHAYLPVYLIKKGIIDKAIAGEVATGPYQSALNNVRKQKVMNQVSVRLADGLQVIEESDPVDTVTIAGMGGTLIASILDKGKNRLTNVKRIITQPNIHAQAIRQWAVDNKWCVVNEKILKEDGKIYEIVVLEKGDSTYNELELIVGPILVKEKNDAFYEKWTSEKKQWEHVLKSIENATETPEIIMKRTHLKHSIDLIGKVLEK